MIFGLAAIHSLMIVAGDRSFMEAMCGTKQVMPNPSWSFFWHVTRRETPLSDTDTCSILKALVSADLRTPKKDTQTMALFLRSVMDLS